MPLSSYYKGKGAQVMRRMQKTYGKRRGRQVFYATANKRRRRRRTRRR